MASIFSLVAGRSSFVTADHLQRFSSRVWRRNKWGEVDPKIVYAFSEVEGCYGNFLIKSSWLDNKGIEAFATNLCGNEPGGFAYGVDCYMKKENGEVVLPE